VVKDFRESGLQSVGCTGTAGRGTVPDAANQRRIAVAIYLAASIMVLFGAGLLTLEQDFIPQGDARNGAMLCLVLAVADLALVQFLKWTWRKRDGC